MRSLLRRALPVKIKILSTLPALGLLLAMTACGPKPAEPPAPPSPAGPPPQTQASPAETQTAATDPQAAAPGQPGAPEPGNTQPGNPAAPAPEPGNPQSGNMVDAAPGDTTDTAVLFVRKIHAHWQGVNTEALLLRALEVYQQRSKDGFLQFQSEKGIQKVKIEKEELQIDGPAPDFSLRINANAQVDGQTRQAHLVVMRDESKNFHFDSIVLVEPEGKVSYGWSEDASVWVAGQGANPDPGSGTLREGTSSPGS